MNAWVWSSIFHTRDFLFTERADYFSAGASVMYGLFYTPLRLFNVHQRDITRVRPYINVWAVICAAAFFAHVYYLSFVTFSYSYNMTANVVVGIAQNIMWIYYSITRSRSSRGWWVWTPVFVVVYVSCAMSLEIFDFFPLADALDAHALWHAATVPMVWPPLFPLIALDLRVLQLSAERHGIRNPTFKIISREVVINTLIAYEYTNEMHSFYAGTRLIIPDSSPVLPNFEIQMQVAGGIRIFSSIILHSRTAPVHRPNPRRGSAPNTLVSQEIGAYQN
jgi:hypothetical protein